MWSGILCRKLSAAASGVIAWTFTPASSSHSTVSSSPPVAFEEKHPSLPQLCSELSRTLSTRSSVDASILRMQAQSDATDYCVQPRRLTRISHRKIGNIYLYVELRRCLRFQELTSALGCLRQGARQRFRVRLRYCFDLLRWTIADGFSYLQTEGCCCCHDQAARASQCECAALHPRGSHPPYFSMKIPTDPGLRQLANALSQNCGAKMQRELASRSFTDALIRLAGDRVRGPSGNCIEACFY